MRFYTSSFIVLIPKVKDLHSFDKFCLISLCFVAYKNFSKLSVKRFASILPALMSPEQGAFILEGSIFKNITLTKEMLHSINLLAQGDNVMIKIDMAKEYDKVN